MPVIIYEQYLRKFVYICIHQRTNTTATQIWTLRRSRRWFRGGQRDIWPFATGDVCRNVYRRNDHCYYLRTRWQNVRSKKIKAWNYLWTNADPLPVEPLGTTVHENWTNKHNKYIANFLRWFYSYLNVLRIQLCTVVCWKEMTRQL